MYSHPQPVLIHQHEYQQPQSQYQQQIRPPAIVAIQQQSQKSVYSVLDDTERDPLTSAITSTKSVLR